jgi:hypothetical protein
MTTVDSTAAPLPRPSADRDSIYWSKERWRIIPQTLGLMSVQYLLVDAHHNEIVATCKKMSEAMAFRDRIEAAVVADKEAAVWAGHQAAKAAAADR